MAIGKDFPVSEYYRECILDGVTLSRVAGWWSAVLVIKDPKTDRNFLNVYQWQFTEKGWKVRKTFSFKKKKDLQMFQAICEELTTKFPLGT
jgi:hypothetical protein